MTYRLLSKTDVTEGDSCRQKAALFDFRFYSSSEHKQQHEAVTLEEVGGRPVMDRWEEPFDGQIPSAKTVTAFIFLFHLIVWRDPGFLLT